MVRGADKNHAGRRRLFLLGYSLGVVPGRIAEKITAREYVYLAELFLDNAELLRRRAK